MNFVRANRNVPNLIKGMVVPATGVELVTYRLQGGCSTN